MSDKPSAILPGAGASPAGLFAYYVLGVLFTAYVLNYIDRTVISILLDPIKKEFGVSDTLMGLLSGFGFAVFYSLASVPIARWADRYNRRNIAAAGIALWSLMSALCGAAQSYGQLFLARMGVGIGEAAGVAPAHSILSDYFPARQRARTLGMYSAAVYVGIMLSLFLGGWLVSRHGWRAAFIFTGLPGVLVALLVRISIKEPPRGRFDAQSTESSPTLSEAWRAYCSQRSLIYATLGLSVMATANGALLTWVPAFLGRVHHMPIASQGLTLGLIKGAFGTLGALSGGFLVDRLGGTSGRWHLLVSAGSTLLFLPFILVFLCGDDLLIGFGAYAVATVLAGMHLGPIFALAQTLVKPRMRALVAAIVLLASVLTSIGLGPLLGGMINDFLAPTQHANAVRTSLTVLMLFSTLAAFFFWRGARYVESDMAQRQPPMFPHQAHEISGG